MDLRVLRYFVAVADELHFGRAAARLSMTQPPLSRAIKSLETELGCLLLARTPSGVTLTEAGRALVDEATALLEQAGRVRARIGEAAGARAFTVGTLADSAERVASRLATTYRERHPHVTIHIREVDLTDPTAGLRMGLCDVALTRWPFESSGLTVQRLRSDPVGVVLKADDILAFRPTVSIAELSDRRWFRLPDDIDPTWKRFWDIPPGREPRLDDVTVRTVHECLQSVLWNDFVGLAPLAHSLPHGLITVPLRDRPASDLVLAWRSRDANPLIRSFAEVASAVYTEHGKAALPG